MKSQKLGNQLVAFTRRCHGQAGGHARRDAGGGKYLGLWEGEKGRVSGWGSLLRHSLEPEFGLLLLL